MASPVLAGLVVLMIGDSHLAYPGALVTTLQDLLVRQGANVTSYGACGAPAAVWANGGAASCGLAERVQFGPIKMDHSTAAPVPAISTLASSMHPGLIIICLGDTMAHYPEATMPVGTGRQRHRQSDRPAAGDQYPLHLGRAGLGNGGWPLFQDLRPQQADERSTGQPGGALPICRFNQARSARRMEYLGRPALHRPRLPEMGLRDRCRRAEHGTARRLLIRRRPAPPGRAAPRPDRSPQRRPCNAPVPAGPNAPARIPRPA